jgi:putative peptidoglycan lipid II flippase
LQFLTGADGIPQLIDLNGRFYGSMALADAAGANLADAWGRQVLDLDVPPLTDAPAGVRFSWLAGDLRRAFTERRGGVARDISSTLRWAKGAHKSVWDVRDPGPTWNLVHVARPAGTLSLTGSREGARVNEDSGTGEGRQSKRSPSAPPADGSGGGEGSRRGSTLVGAGILLSRLTGLARERAFGHFLGTSIAADAFTAAFRIPNFLQHLLGEGVLSASFIPVYSRLLSEGREDDARRVAGAIAGLLTAAAGVLAVAGILLAEPLTLLVAPGLRAQPETFDLTVTLVRILFPGVGLLVLSAWSLGVLNSHRRFFLSYVAPVMLNVAQIAVLVGVGLTVLSSEFADTDPSEAAQTSLVTWLAVGTVAGGALQFLIQLPAVLRLNRGVPLTLRTDRPGVREVLRAFGPVVAGRGVVQLSSYVQVFLASFLAAGALATLRYSMILYTLPISLFAMSVAAAELPELSRGNPTERRARTARVQRGLTRIAVLIVPTALGYAVIGDLITATLFQTGAFDRLDAVAVWIVLAGFATGLLATTSSRLLQSVLYGIGDTRTPARLAALRVAVSVALGVILMVQMDRLAVTATGLQLLGDLPAVGPLPDTARDAAGARTLVRLGAAGLSLGSGLAAWVEYVLLHRAVRRKIGPTTLAGGRLGAVLSAGLVAAGVVALARPLLVPLHPLVAGPVAVMTMAAVYIPVALILGVSEASIVLKRPRRRPPGA